MTNQLALDYTAALHSDEARYRASDPLTSKQAARAVKAGTQRARALLALADAPRGLTGYECAQACGILRVHGATTRLDELMALGFASRDGSTRPTDSGCLALVFYVTEKGREEAERLKGEE